MKKKIKYKDMSKILTSKKNLPKKRKKKSLGGMKLSKGITG